MTARGYRYHFRLTYAYDNGRKGSIPMPDVDSAWARARELAVSVDARREAGTYRVIAVADDGTRAQIGDAVTVADLAAAVRAESAELAHRDAPTTTPSEPDWLDNLYAEDAAPASSPARVRAVGAPPRPAPGSVTVTLSAHAYTMLCGLVQPSEDVNADGIVGPDDEWAELRRVFPLDHFRAHAFTGDPDAGIEAWDVEAHGGVGYDEHAGE